MAFQNAIGTTVQGGSFYDVGGHQFNIGPVIQVSNPDGVLIPKRAPLMKSCPSPTNLFTGRNDILLQLHQCFTPSPTSVESAEQRRFVLYGLGGGGKTQIALKFVKECQTETQPRRFSDVFFIDSSTAQTIDADLKSIARGKEIGETANDALIWLAGKRDDWLLLFDNADDISLNLSQFFPSCSHGNILITSRNYETLLHAPAFNCNIASLTPEDATNLLLGIVKQVTTDESRVLAECIVKELGHLALAVVQAGAYILMSGNLGGYLDIYKKRRTKLLQEYRRQRADNYKMDRIYNLADQLREA